MQADCIPARLEKFRIGNGRAKNVSEEISENHKLAGNAAAKAIPEVYKNCERSEPDHR